MQWKRRPKISIILFLTTIGMENVSYANCDYIYESQFHATGSSNCIVTNADLATYAPGGYIASYVVNGGIKYFNVPVAAAPNASLTIEGSLDIILNAYDIHGVETGRSYGTSGGVINLNGDSYNIYAVHQYTHGLSVYEPGGIINVANDFSYNQTTQYGASVSNKGLGSRAIYNNGGEINIYGHTVINMGLFALSTAGISVATGGVVNLNTANILTTGNKNIGITGEIAGGGGRITSTGLVDITTDTGVAINTRGNELNLLLDSLKITTDTGNAVILDSNSTLYVTNNMDIETTGDNASGITVNGSGDYSAGSGQITTYGANAYGIYEKQDSTAIDRSITFNVDTYGANSHALYFESDLNNDLEVKLKGNITAQGIGSNALLINATNSQNINLNITNGFNVKAKDDAIKFNASHNGDIVLEGNNTVASNDGNAINASNLLGNLKITASNSTISAGNAAILGSQGDNAIKLVGGSVIGNIETYNGDDNIELSANKMTGSILTGDGNDVVTLSDNFDATGLREIDFGISGLNTLNVANSDITGSNGLLASSLGTAIKNADEINLVKSRFTQSGDLFDASRSGVLNLDDNSSWDMASNLTNMTIFGDVNNAGIINIGHQGITGATLTVTGDYQGNSGSLFLNTTLNDELSTTDKLLIAGDAKGSTKIYITNVNGNGAHVNGEGIELVNVGGISDNNAFTLGRPVTSELYEYLLHKGSSDENWYLNNKLLKTGVVDTPSSSTTLYNPALSTYIANQSASLNMFKMRYFDRLNGQENENENYHFWGRQEGRISKGRSILANLKESKGKHYLIQLGADVKTLNLSHGVLTLGTMVGYGYSSSSNKSAYTNTSSDGVVKGINLGVYATWHRNNDRTGLYTDFWMQYNWYQNEVTGNAQLYKNKYRSRLWTTSIELGYVFKSKYNENYNILITPQAQILYNYYTSKQSSDSNGLYLSSGKNKNSIDTRVGLNLALEYKESLKSFIEFNWLHSSNSFNRNSFNHVNFRDITPSNRYEVLLGIKGDIDKNWVIGARVSTIFGKDRYREYVARLQVSYRF